MSADRSIPTGPPNPQGYGEDPLFHFTKVYVMFLQGLFKQFPSGCYRWSENPKDSEIVITDQAPIPLDHIEQRPAIVTMRGPAQFANLSLDNLVSQDSKTGQRTHADLVACTMTINCMAKFGLEAQRIAWIVMRHIRTFKRLLQRQGQMHKVGDEVSIGPESPPGAMVVPEPDSELVNVVVASPFFFQWSEKVTPTNSELLQNIEMHMCAQTSPPEALTTKAWEANVKLKRPTIKGVPIEGDSVQIGTKITQTVKIC